jgi:hypothetical protein
MSSPPRPPRILHVTSEPYRFFGREAELALLTEAYRGGDASVVALIGPGGQGKTAIAQHWLASLQQGSGAAGTFLWSFYRGKEADHCLREWYAYAEGLTVAPEVSASYCVDYLLPRLHRERWAVVLDGTEVVQYESGSWRGRFVHPELGRLLEEIGSEAMPGVVLLTTRFPLPTLSLRPHTRLLSLSSLDPLSARGLLQSLGVQGEDSELDEVARRGGMHAKAVELLGTYLVRFHQRRASAVRALLGASSSVAPDSSEAEEESRVLNVLEAYQNALPVEIQDVLALATHFREPPGEQQVLDYLASPPVQNLLHGVWQRTYVPFQERGRDWLQRQLDELIALRLLERVHAGAGPQVIDAHPLVRRAFEDALGGDARREGARARAGFLHGRPDRSKPQSLEEARQEVELFHAFCDAGLWEEADNAYRALDNPKHRFLAPALERDLLARFFPEGDLHRAPLWAGFGRYRSLAICLEMLGQFEEALRLYRGGDEPLRGDALLALGQLEPLLQVPQVAPPWQTLWRAYRAHALTLAGRTEQALALARSLIPQDIYEWVHVFECLLRLQQLDSFNLTGMLPSRSPTPAQGSGQHLWTDLARRRMHADHRRVLGTGDDLEGEYRDLLEAYDRGGLPYERVLTRLGFARWLLAKGEVQQMRPVLELALDLAQQYRLPILQADLWRLSREHARVEGDALEAQRAGEKEEKIREQAGYQGPSRP